MSGPCDYQLWPIAPNSTECSPEELGPCMAQVLSSLSLAQSACDTECISSLQAPSLLAPVHLRPVFQTELNGVT